MCKCTPLALLRQGQSPFSTESLSPSGFLDSQLRGLQHRHSTLAIKTLPDKGCRLITRVLRNAPLPGARLAQITTNTSRTIISGHSRGGKVAFSLMNNKNPAGNTTFIGVAGVDPVDGGGPMSVSDRS